MDFDIKLLLNLFQFHFNEPIIKHEKFPSSGGSRIYVRIFGTKNQVIGTFGANIEENYTFFYLSEHFSSLHLSVPNVIATSGDGLYYLQKDIGQFTLFDLIKKYNFNYQSELIDYFQQSLQQLIKLQVIGHQGLQYHKLYQGSYFGRIAIINDCNYFKYYYLNLLGYQYNEINLQIDFNTIADLVLSNPYRYFMMRDCQSRNIVLNKNTSFTPTFVDFQGGRLGPIQYDVASLLYQARAKIPNPIKEKLLQYYLQELSKEIKINQNQFLKTWHWIILLRQLQVLGAYGRRGIIQGKSGFSDYIPDVVSNIRQSIESNSMNNTIPEIAKALNQTNSIDFSKFS